MKKLTSFVLSTSLLLAVLLMQSCEKVKDLIKINVPTEQEVYFDIPILEETGTATFAENNIYLNIDSIIKAKDPGFGIGEIKSVKVNSCSMEILNADDTHHFGIIKSVKAEVKSDINNTWETIGQVNDVNLNGVSAILIASGIDLAPYFKTSQFSYRFSGTTTSGTTKVLNCKATVKYQITVGL